MDYTPRYPIRSSSESSTTVYATSPERQFQVKAHWSEKMYSAQQLTSSKKQQLLMGSVDENPKNYNIGRMYSTKQSLSVDSMTSPPKKETLWQTVFRSATNLLGDHFNRGTGSLLRNWSNMNNPLSVTVVSQDFYKSLQRGKDHQLVDPYTARAWSKDSHNSDKTLPNILYDNEIKSDSVTRINSDTSDSDKRWKEYKCMYINCNETQEKDLISDQKIVNSVNNSVCKDNNLETHFNNTVDTIKVDTSTSFGNTIKVDDDPVVLEKPESISEDEQELQQLQPQQQQHQEEKETDSKSQEISAEPASTVGSILTNAYKKVMGGMTELLQRRSGTPEPETSTLFCKRVGPSKPRSKRSHNVSSGRGRGRAKSQLRRSGVSQTRHRKERSHHEDIQNDLDSWEELEYGDNSTEDEKFEEVDASDLTSRHPTAFTLGDVKPKKRKPKKAKNTSWSQLGVQNLDDDGDIEFSVPDKVAFRQRLLSESSVDSEDSYCIVFEDDANSTESDDETDDESEESDTETDSEADLTSDDEVPRTKVRFNLTPVVHPMIQWNYAYRAARRGPWEQMARDRERFRTRINCIGRIIEPALGKQHRTRIWHERFED